MESLTLQQLFGVNAVQDSQALIIQKSDLPLLTPIDSNTPESLLVAILLKSLENFQGFLIDELGGLLKDETDSGLEFDNTNLYELISVFKWDERFKGRNNQIYLTNTIILEIYEPMA